MGKIISIINYKGGVGKTTLTLQLGIALNTMHNSSILLVDLDPQCSLSLSTLDENYWADRVDRTGSVRNVFSSYYEKDGVRLEKEWVINNALDRSWDSVPGNTPDLDLLPSHLDLPMYEMKLVSKKPAHIANQEEFIGGRDFILREALQTIRRSYDYILLDCPPNIYMASRNAIMASDYYLIPTIPDFISCYGIPFILQHIETIKSEAKQSGSRMGAKFLGIVRNRVRLSGSGLVREHEEQSQKLKLEYGDHLFRSLVVDRIGVAELQSIRKNIQRESGGRYEDVRLDFRHLALEFIQRMESQ
jgi:chromosome partitioning protein